MRLASPVSRSAVLLALLGLSLPAAAQERRALPPPPAVGLSLPPDPASEPAAGAADARGGASLTRVGEWAYGPSYAIATFGESVVSGHGRVLRIDGPPGTIPGREDIVLPGLVRDVAVGSSLIYVATSSVLAGGRGITVVEPSPAGSGIAGGVYGRSCVSVAAAGARVYAVVYDPALVSYVLLVLDATAPGLVPAVLGEVVIDGTGGGIAVLGTTVYVAAGAAGTAVIDAADAAAPAVVRYLTAGSFDRRVSVQVRNGTSRLAVGSGTYPSEGSVSVFDAAAPAQPSLLYQTTGFQSPVEDVLWNPNEDTFGLVYLYVAASYSGVYALDGNGNAQYSAYTTPANVVPGVTRLAGAPSQSGQIFAADYYYGTFAYESVLFSGYTRLDEGENFALDAEADSQDPGTVYVADGTAGIVRLHAEAGGRLVETGRAHDAAWNYTRALAQNATHLYAADGFSGLQVVDKATMTRVGELAAFNQGNVDAVAVSADGLTLFMHYGTTAEAYALADPARPAFLWTRGNLDAGSFASAGGVLYVGERTGSNVRVLSLADPANPVQTLTLPTSGTNVSVVLSGARLYARGGASRVSVFDTSAPDAPVLLGTVSAGGGLIDARGTALYSGGASGLAAYDATTPGSPVLLATYNDGRVGTISNVAATATDVFLAEGSSGVERIAAQLATAGEAVPEADLALRVAPNPAAGRVAVVFSLAEAGAVEADVLDVLGRRVAVLASGPAPAGAQRLEWDGTGAGGRRVAAGLYVVRVRTGAGIQTQRLTVVR